MALPEVAWIGTARKYIGVKEIKGPQHNPHVLRWWSSMGTHYKDDETPWCGAFVGGVLIETGHKAQPGGAAARAWLKYGVKLDKPAYGAIVVFWRGSPGGSAGHVGFVVGQDQRGRLMVLGGNQNDSVNVSPFDTARVLGYRWPGVFPYAERFNLPIIRTDAKSSTNEA